MIEFPKAIPRLVGAKVCLRELREHDIPAWFARATDAESADLAGDPIPGSITLGAPWLQRQRDHFRAGTGVRWAIEVNGGTESVGTVGLTITSASLRTAELGVVLARAQWGRGIATDACHLAIRFAFDLLLLSAVHAEVLVRNPASIRMLEKVGFARVEGTAPVPDVAKDPDACLRYVLRGPGVVA